MKRKPSRINLSSCQSVFLVVAAPCKRRVGSPGWREACTTLGTVSADTESVSRSGHVENPPACGRNHFPNHPARARSPRPRRSRAHRAFSVTPSFQKGRGGSAAKIGRHGGHPSSWFFRWALPRRMPRCGRRVAVRFPIFSADRRVSVSLSPPTPVPRRPFAPALRAPPVSLRSSRA